MKIFLFILILTSGMEIIGYPLVDVILMGIFFFTLTAINRRPLKIRIDWVLIFNIYIMLQIIRGMYVLDDYRMAYWVYFFAILCFSHQYLYDMYKKSKIDHQFAEQIFNYSLVYFIIYGLLGFFIENPDNFQGIYWVGSSGAFLVLIPFFCSHFVIVQNSGYSLSQLKLPSILVFLAAATIHQSRVGVYFLFFYLLCLVFRAAIFNLRKFVLMSCIVGVCLFAWSSGRGLLYTNPNPAGTTETLMVQNILGGDTGLEGQADIGRILMIFSIYDKFISSPVEMLIGSGWYTSRQTLKPYARELRMQYGLNVSHLDNEKPLQVITLAAIISDLGIVGLFFILYFFFKSARQILQTKSRGCTMFLMFLLLNWLFFLIAYSTTSILSFLLFLPNGLIVCLARANSSHSQIIEQATKND